MQLRLFRKLDVNYLLETMRYVIDPGETVIGWAIGKFSLRKNCEQIMSVKKDLKKRKTVG